MKVFKDLYKETISSENLFRAWKVFHRGKARKKDVMEFEYSLEQNIFKLHRDLRNRRYKHGPYKGFYITDPKQRHIHKVTVIDRVLHHSIYAQLYPLFNPTFIVTSFSCRIGKGMHRGVAWLDSALRKVSRNYTQPCFVMKCDVKRFFDNLDHNIFLSILRKRFKYKDMMWLIAEVIHSFSSGRSNLLERKELSLENLTSQLFAYIYMNEFDQFIKHKLKAHYYGRHN